MLTRDLASNTFKTASSNAVCFASVASSRGINSKRISIAYINCDRVYSCAALFKNAINSGVSSITFSGASTVFTTKILRKNCNNPFTNCVGSRPNSTSCATISNAFPALFDTHASCNFM